MNQSLIREKTPKQTEISDRFLISRNRAFYTFTLLFLLTLFDLIDRQVIASLLPYIKQDWNLSDTQIGLLVSLVNVAITIFALPVAITIDRWSRRKMITLMALIWSFGTLATGLAQNFSQILLARFLIGAGQAGYGPASTSVLSAIFPRRLRSTVLGLNNMAAPLGGMLGVLLGGILAELYGWHRALGILVIPGIVLAVLIWFTQDYETVQLEGKDAEQVKQARVPFWGFLRQLLSTPTLIAAYLGNAAQLFFSSTIMNWMPSYFQRFGNMGTTAASLRTSAVLLVAALGTFVGAIIADRWAGRLPRARLIAPAIYASFNSLIFIFAFVNGGVLFPIILVGAIALTAGLGPISAVTQDASHPGMWATSNSLLIVIQNLAGMTLGPLVVGMISDRFNLHVALTLASFMPLLAAFSFFIGSIFYDRDCAKVKRVTISAE